MPPMKPRSPGRLHKAGIPLAFFCLIAAALSAPLRIMPVGDSITAGYTDNPAAGGTTGWTVPFEFGYRRQLYQLLENAGYDFVFVGGSLEPFNNLYGDPTHGGTVSPVFDLRPIGQNGHRGYGGIRIPQINTSIVSYLNTDDPDIILLMIGINGMDSGSPAELATLVNDIVATKPDAHLILAQITPMSSNVTYAAKNADLVSYNTYIRETLVPTLQSQGKNISTVDQYTTFLTDPGNPSSEINAALFSNGINHPTNPAYDTMAGIWFSGIQALVPAPATPLLSATQFLPGIPQGSTVGTFTTTPPAVPEAFTYSFATGPGDTDNAKFTLAGSQLKTGSHNFNSDPAGTTYHIRVKATGSTSGTIGNETFILTTIPTDSDNDQLPDSWEIAKAGDLTTLNGSGDHDADGLTDLAEFNLSSTTYPAIDPTDPDTDRDGLPDGAETSGAGARPPTKPTLADTDGDSLGDLNEDNTGTYLDLLHTGTNPILADSDSDATGDGVELLQGSSPLNPASPAAPGIAGVSSTTISAYAADVSSSDLVQGLTGSNAVHTGWYLNNSATPAKLTDGIHGPGVVPVEGGWSQANGSVTTYTLPAGTGDGWDLSGITTIADWPGGGFANQRYEVGVRRAGETGFSPLASVNLQPFTATGSGASRVRITHPSGRLANRVMQVRFTMLSTNGNSGRAVYREFDVFGTPSVAPLPSILSVTGPSPALPRLALTWLSWPGETYKIERSVNLTDWQTLDAAFPSGGVTTGFRPDADPATAPRSFFRVSPNP